MIQKLIDAYELEREMYRKCIDTDEEIEKGRVKWDSGLWIRYKVFEDAITLAPTVDAVEVVRCKDCKYYEEYKNGEYRCWKMILDPAKPTDFCSRGERREDAKID